ncbi:hypothetical protein Back2_19220 [Nocardioides baekrokdamisoli]|uniref:RDD domain-containing protein n=1 Tax=Nocardioides baekrokdamisoli TaxID=1804624 RepID=A0A3G9INM1_9ACTN|nr:RDD family protein [Nocardioides baekrokdamisoli]BBH17635.1 hypothetical protein Back2_19220 [Nocardioides baekrokdamisoli]
MLDGLFSSLAVAPLWVGYIMIFSHLHTDQTVTRYSDGYAYTEPTMKFDLSGGMLGLAIVLIIIGVVAGLAFGIWNLMIRQGRTGYSLGKGIVGIKLIREDNGQPIGAWLALGRALLHILDALPCYIGYFWPLWDKKHQTFADMIVGTVVIEAQKV